MSTNIWTNYFFNKSLFQTKLLAAIYAKSACNLTCSSFFGLMYWPREFFLPLFTSLFLHLNFFKGNFFILIMKNHWLILPIAVHDVSKFKIVSKELAGCIYEYITSYVHFRTIFFFTNKGRFSLEYFMRSFLIIFV